jgi:two-component system, NtrC family, response regulator AtoC
MPNLEPTTERLSLVRGEAASGAYPYALLVIAGERTSSYPLTREGHVLVGRSKAADICIDHASVSREHAVLSLGSALQVEDLGSSNGTRVRGQALAPETPIEIAPGEVIDLGEVLLVVQHRRLEQGLARVCSAPFFDQRVRELENEPARDAFLARFSVRGALSLQALEVIIASTLREGELVSAKGPGTFEVLLSRDLELTPSTRIEQIAQVLRRRELDVVSEMLPPLARAPSVEPGTRPGRATPRPPRELVPACVVRDPAMQTVLSLLERVAASDIGVLLLGETGTGKEVCAEFIVRASMRSERKFLRLNCAALSESLLESELFGHEKGAFTGASKERVGLLESAHGGTLFLDEVGDMPLSTQAKLLRALEAKEVLRVGATTVRRVDIRILSATNRDLRELITLGLFREDLYYRLNGISVLVPPLRERPLDIEPLAEHFLREAATNRGSTPSFSPASRAWLRAHVWPGNARELKNVVERALLLFDDGEIEPRHLAAELLPGAPSSGRGSEARGLREEVKDLERDRIERALREEGNQREAARALGISRGALVRRLDQLGLPRPRRGS